jgi:hypothetical protein
VSKTDQNRVKKIPKNCTNAPRSATIGNNLPKNVEIFQKVGQSATIGNNLPKNVEIFQKSGTILEKSGTILEKM